MHSPEQSARLQFYENPETTTLPWRIGEGGINMDDLLVIGIVHVSPGAFQVIVQLTRPLQGVVLS